MLLGSVLGVPQPHRLRAARTIQRRGGDGGGLRCCRGRCSAGRRPAAQEHGCAREAQAFLDTFRTYYGPVLRAWDTLDEPGRESFQRELMVLLDASNRSTTGHLAVPSEYLEVVARRR